MCGGIGKRYLDQHQAQGSKPVLQRVVDVVMTNPSNMRGANPRHIAPATTRTGTEKSMHTVKKWSKESRRPYILITEDGERIDLTKSGTSLTGAKLGPTAARQTKYNSKSTVYNGNYYQSLLEANYARELDIRVRAGLIKSWRRQVKISLDLYGFHIANYYMDFELTHNDESIEMVEVKGAETDVWKMKWRLTEALFSKERPEVKLTIVK